jgi:hypothetical protein
VSLPARTKRHFRDPKKYTTISVFVEETESLLALCNLLFRQLLHHPSLLFPSRSSSAPSFLSLCLSDLVVASQASRPNTNPKHSSPSTRPLQSQNATKTQKRKNRLELPKASLETRNHEGLDKTNESHSHKPNGPAAAAAAEENTTESGGKTKSCCPQQQRLLLDFLAFSRILLIYQEIQELGCKDLKFCAQLL